MKTVYALMVMLICMTGCSFRDGAATSAAIVGSTFDSMIGAHGTYANNKAYWDKKFAKKRPTDTVITGED